MKRRKFKPQTTSWDCVKFSVVKGIPTVAVQPASVIWAYDGWIEITLAAPSDALVPWVLSFGVDAEALGPPELRAAVRERLESVVAGA